MSEERKLVLDIQNDGAARSVMYAYLLARGVAPLEPGGINHALKLAQDLASSPDEGENTACQTWDQFGRVFGKQALNDSGEIRAALDSIGYEVAAVLLRRSQGAETLRFSRVRVCRQVEEGLHEVHAEVPVQPKPNQRFATPSLVYVVSDFQGTALEAKALAQEIAWNIADGASPDEYSSGHSAAS